MHWHGTTTRTVGCRVKGRCLGVEVQVADTHTHHTVPCVCVCLPVSLLIWVYYQNSWLQGERSLCQHRSSSSIPGCVSVCCVLEQDASSALPQLNNERHIGHPLVVKIVLRNKFLPLCAE